jgi:hypothetical protein
VRPHQPGDQCIRAGIGLLFPGQVDDGAQRRRDAQVADRHEVALVEHHLAQGIALGPLRAAARRDIHTQLVAPGRQRKRAVDPGRGSALGDEAVGESQGKGGGSLRRPIGLVERAEGLVDRVQLTVQPRRAQLGERKVVARQHAGQSHVSMVAARIGRHRPIRRTVDNRRRGRT